MRPKSLHVHNIFCSACGKTFAVVAWTRRLAMAEFERTHEHGPKEMEVVVAAVPKRLAPLPVLPTRQE